METFVLVQFKSDTVFGAEAIFLSGILQFFVDAVTAGGL